MPALITLFFCNWGLYSARVISCCAAEWGTTRQKDFYCMQNTGRESRNGWEPYWKEGLHQSVLGCDAHSVHVEILLVSLEIYNTVTVDNSNKKWILFFLSDWFSSCRPNECWTHPTEIATVIMVTWPLHHMRMLNWAHQRETRRLASLLFIY